MATLYEPETIHFHDKRVAELEVLNAGNTAYYGRLCLAIKRREDFKKPQTIRILSKL